MDNDISLNLIEKLMETAICSRNYSTFNMSCTTNNSFSFFFPTTPLPDRVSTRLCSASNLLIILHVYALITGLIEGVIHINLFFLIWLHPVSERGKLGFTYFKQKINKLQNMCSFFNGLKFNFINLDCWKNYICLIFFYSN